MISDVFYDLKRRAREFFGNPEQTALIRSLVTPRAPFHRGSLVSALVASASLISVAILAGMGIAALLVLLASLFLVSVVLVKVLGVDLELFPGGPFQG